MFVHIVAEHLSKISELQALLGAQFRVSSALLDGESSIPGECDAIVIAADLRRANNVAMLRGMSEAFKRAQRRVFVVDQKARLCAAQAYALNATHVLFNPVYQRNLIAALTKSDTAKEPPGMSRARTEPPPTGPPRLLRCSPSSPAASGSM
jgi:hypothetical protein